MRSFIYSLFIFLGLSSMFGCTTSSSEEKEQKTVTLQQANWNDTTTLAKVIDKYYQDSVFRKGKIALKVRDPFLRSSVPYRHLQLHKIHRPDFKLTTPTVGYMPVLMLVGSDSAIVDFQLTWKQTNPYDSTGTFVVTDQFVQTLRNQPRYEWVKEEKYWTRRNVEIPAEYKNRRENPLVDSDKIDQREIKQKEEKTATRK